MFTRFKKWTLKIADEYRRSDMSPLPFVYWTIISNIGDAKLRWKWKHEGEEARLLRSIHKKLDEMVRKAECSQ